MPIEFWVGVKQGEFGLEDCIGLVSRYPQYASRAVSSALKSEGNRLRDIIKLHMRRGGQEEGWPGLHPHTLAIRASRKRHNRWAAQEAKGRKVRASTKAKYRGHREVDPAGIFPLQKLAGAVRYKYDDTIETVTIGFLDKNKRGIAEKHADGFTYKVTSPMRKLLAMNGFPVREGTLLKVPARPVVEPVFEKEKANILKNVRAKTIANIQRYITGAAKE